jgi:uncharacterized Zn finger protein
MANTGRPKKEIDQRMFESLCEIQCTQAEICGVFDITDKTLTRWCQETYGESFSDIYKTKSGVGKISLRRLQFDKAKQGSVPMLIWLGKQYLGQSDKNEVTENLATVKLDSLIEQLEQDDSNTEA